MKFLSVIVPVYNCKEYLAQCIDSILGQTYRDFELILVDDGSTDGSGKLCDEYAEKNSRIRVIHKKNGGLISAKQTGLNAAEGEYIGFVDGDDWISPDMYQVLCSEAAKNNVEIVIADNDAYIGNRIIKIDQGIEAGFYNKDSLREKVYPNLARVVENGQFKGLGVSPSLCNKVIKKELLMTYQFRVDPRIRGGEDAACSYPCILSAESLHYVKGFYPYHYRIHNKSMTHHKALLNEIERFTLIEHMMDVKEKFSYTGVDIQLEIYSIGVINELLLNRIENRKLFTEEQMNDMVNLIKRTAFWATAKRYMEIDLPQQMIDSLKYIEYGDIRAYNRLLRFVQIGQVKQLIKRIIYRE